MYRKYDSNESKCAGNDALLSERLRTFLQERNRELDCSRRSKVTHFPPFIPRTVLPLANLIMAHLPFLAENPNGMPLLRRLPKNGDKTYITKDFARAMTTTRRENFRTTGIEEFPGGGSRF
jgi:hypothetical protein